MISFLGMCKICGDACGTEAAMFEWKEDLFTLCEEHAEKVMELVIREMENNV